MTEESITIKKNTLWKVGTFIFAILFLLSVFGAFNGNGKVIKEIIPSDNAPSASGNAKIKIEDNDPVLGDTTAEISIVEFSDFQCPFCGRAHADALADMRKSDGFKNGEYNFIYKQFPLTSIHSHAQNAGEASLCAQDQGKFWEYHDTLFANQQALDDASLKFYAQQLGLDAATFDACLDGDEKASEVKKEIQQAVDAGGQGTPYFVVINNKNKKTEAVSGAVPWSQIEEAINAVK
ncbi:DsbA family protein [Candidatus Pacearchaeota archaeon]|nr:DsbA family protein [Candidatus Pacearchaeota archaeon]MBI2056648.1 DsbA family protein [Candidatus Pacearchaeota archaeon]